MPAKQTLPPIRAIAKNPPLLGMPPIEVRNNEVLNVPRAIAVNMKPRAWAPPSSSSVTSTGMSAWFGPIMNSPVFTISPITTSSGTLPRRNRHASTRSPRTEKAGRSARSGICVAARLSGSRVSVLRTRNAACTANDASIPHNGISRPANAGPISCEEVRAIDPVTTALSKSSRGRSIGIIACRVGSPTAVLLPRMTA